MGYDQRWREPPPEQRIGRTLAEYGSFQVRELSYIFASGRVIRLGELVFDHPLEDEADQQVSNSKIAIAVLPLERNTVPHVLRYIRIWLNARRRTYLEWQELLNQQQVQGTPFEDGREWTPDEIADENKALQAELRRYHIVEDTLLELEAEHPELDLGPIEDTIDPDPDGNRRFNE